MASDGLLFGQTMETLRAYSLVGRDPGRQTLSVHRLVQAVMRDGMEATDRQCWAERAIRAVCATLPKVEHANWSRWERLLAHVQACAELIEPEGLHLQEAAEVLRQAGWYVTERARFSEAEPLLERAYQVSERQLGPAHPDTAQSLNNLAHLYYAQGKYEQAEPLLVRALAIYEQQLGPLHPQTLITRGNYVAFLRTMGRDVEAAELEIKHLPPF